MIGYKYGVFTGYVFARKTGVSEKQVYPQIRALGEDLSGAFSFTDIAPDPNAPASFRLLGEAELAERLNNKEDFGLLHWDDKLRLSVAGVQDKLNVFVTAQGQIAQRTF